MERDKITPKKRSKAEMDELLDLISSLKSAILIKLRLESEMKAQKTLISILKLKPLFSFITFLFAPIWTLGYWKSRTIRRIEMERDLEVKVKARNKYHKNELMIEEALTIVKEEMDERFDRYLLTLHTKGEDSDPDSELPYQDVQLLLKKYREDPPKDNQEKLEFYLSMENTLTQF